MGEFYPPDYQSPSTVIGGVVTVLVPGVPYASRIRRAIVSCTGQSSVIIYSGMPGGIVLAQNTFGSQNTFSPANPSPVPPGTPLYVQWPEAIAGTHTATLTLARTGELS